MSDSWGFLLLVMVYAIGNISGCHINPAVSVAMLVAGKFKGKTTIAYIIAQCVGAIVAAGILLLIAQGQGDYSLAVDGLGQNGYGSLSPGGYSLVACFIAEVVLTGLFLFVIFGTMSKDIPIGFAGIPIGFALVIVHIVGIPIMGTSVNPARSLGPAVFMGGDTLSQLWLFWVAPVTGGIIAAVVWRYLFDKSEKI